MESQVGDTLARPAQIVLAEEKLTAYSRKALAGSVIGYCMDGFDMLILGFMLATISADLALTNSQAGSLVTWTLVGAVAGGVIFWDLERSLRANSYSDLDDSDFRRLHLPLSFRTRLLGPRCVPSHCWSRSGGRIRYRHGPGC